MSRRRRRRVPVVTVVLLAVAIVAPVVPIALGLLGWQGEIGLFILTQPALGLIGGIAALFYRSITWSDRVGWAIVSAITGFVLVPVWWRVLILLLGP